MNRKIIVFILLIIAALVRSQSSNDFLRTRDSILRLNDDSLKLDALIKLCKDHGDYKFVEVMRLSGTAFKLAGDLKLYKKKAKLYNVIGDKLFNKASYQESFRYYYAGYKLADSINSKFYKAMSAYNLGWQAAIQQKNYQDVRYIYESLKIGEEIGSNGVILRAQNALGSFYTDKFERERKQSDFDSAVKYFSVAIEICNGMKAFDAVGPLYSNLGQLFYHSKDYSSSIFYYEKSIRTFKDSNNIVFSLLKVGASKFGAKKYSEAIKIYEFVYKYLKRVDVPEMRRDCLNCLKDYYRETGDNKKLFEIQREFIVVNDSLEHDLQAFTISNMDTEYEYARSKENNVQLERAAEIQELRSKRKTIFIYIFALFGCVIIVIAFLLFRQNKLKKQTNLLLRSQHLTILEKTAEIEQSIEYAKGIQTVFLPNEEDLKLLLKSYFIIYKPKDVVSGDFYWYMKTDDGILLACADCTGHGVPGALMSMVGINILQQLSVERKMRSPGSILKYLNAEIKNSLKQNTDQSTQRDGMDIAMIYLDLAQKKLIYSGANRPLYIVRDAQLIEYKATKHAIGGFTKYDQSFEETKIDLQNDDLICLTTDGYADQFGKDGKKFMTKRLKELLTNISQKSAAEQMAELESVFNNWKGLQEQVDDVCVIGIKV